MEQKIIIIDNGSAYIKGGYSTEDTHQLICPTVVALPKDGSGIPQFGEEAINNRATLNLKYPIKRGVIQDWDNMLKLWEYCFTELKATPDTQGILMTEPPVNTTSAREKVTQIMFEQYNTPTFYLQSQSVLSLYASGRTSGVILESGDGVTNVVPIYEGYDLKYSILRIDVAGSDVNEFLLQQIKEQSPPIDFPVDIETARDIKEKHCFVTLDAQEEMKNAPKNKHLEEKYTMPDGKTITLKTERFVAPELIFEPLLMGLEDPGIHEGLVETIKKCPVDVRRELYEHIFLAGGNTLFTGFVERLNKELTPLVPPAVTPHIHATPERWNMAWLGGSLLAGLKSFEEQWITKKDYDEIGPTVVHKMCK